jgi:hypothetical protein
MNQKTFLIPRSRRSFVPAVLFFPLLWLSFFAASGQQDYSKTVFKPGYDRSNVLIPDASLFYKDGSADHGYSRARFVSDASFSDDVFQGKVDCRQILFPNDIDFEKTTFADVADFTQDTFISVAHFSAARFHRDCHFMLATFNSYVDFSGASFRGTGYFSNLTLSDTTVLDFDGAVLPDTLDFSANPRIPLEINLSAANFTAAGPGRWRPKTHYIYLYGSDISRFRLDYRNFALIFRDPKDGSEMENDDKISVYESLLKNFQDRGQLESYASLDVEFQDYIWGTLPIPIRWFYVFPHYWNYYRHKTGLVFFWALVFLSIFTLINFKYLDWLAKDVYRISSVKDFPTAAAVDAMPKGKERKHMVRERFWAAFVYTSTIFFLLSLNMNRFTFSHRRAAFYIIVVFVTGVICIAYMANFVIAK